jgi:patatin-like phospholipase
MASFPLELHQVLEEEYVSMYGPLARLGALYDEKQVLDLQWARVLLHDCGIDVDADAREIAEELNELVKARKAPAVGGSQAITERGKVLLEGYEEFRKLANERDGVSGEMDLRRSIVDEAFPGAVKPLRDLRLANVYTALHGRANDKENPRPRTALCISGGGIRSATFALGIIQGLASAEILKRFDFLSTVSGGGYIGSWLSSWVRRHPKGVAGVEDELQRADTAVAGVSLNAPATSTRRVAPGRGARGDGEPAASTKVQQAAATKKRELPDSKIHPEPQPLAHLREYSNYMSPRLGLLSGDSWSIGSLYIRNLLLNLLVLVPLLALILAIPRLLGWALAQSRFIEPLALPWIAAAFATLGFAYIGRERPVEHGKNVESKKLIKASPDNRFIFGCVVPLTGAAVFLALFWARASSPETRHLLTDRFTLGALLFAVFGMTAVPYVLYYSRYKAASAAARRSGFVGEKKSRADLWKKRGLEAFAMTVALGTTCVLLFLLADKVFDNPLQPTPQLAKLPPVLRFGQQSSPQAQIYLCFAVPAILLIFFIQASIFVGLSSRKNDDSDREWWGRAGAWLLFTAFAVALLSFLAVFGPVALYHAPVILGSLGGVAGAAAAVLGFSDKTPANKKQGEEKSGASTLAGSIASALIVPLFVAFFLAVISLGSTWLIQQVRHTGVDDKAWALSASMQSEFSQTTKLEAGGMSLQLKDTMPAAPRTSIEALRSAAHLQTIQETSGLELLAFLGAALVAFGLSFSIGVNKFSMHAFYRNRLIRAYLGASRYTRDPDVFTGFDENDNLAMWEMRPEMLWMTSLHDIQDLVDVLGKAESEEPRAKLARYLWNAFDPKTRELLEKQPLGKVGVDALVKNVNHLLLTCDLTTLDGVPPPDWIATPEGKIGFCTAFRNRAVLDHYFAKWIRLMALPDDVQRTPPPDLDPNELVQFRAPVHIVNTALNLTSGENLAWQQRMAESFTVSPLHSGSFFLGYRSSREYGGPNGISLGTAVTISGAAASPNMGYHSSPTMAFLLTLFNIRLGSWLGNPGPRGQTSYTESHPNTNLVPLFAEITGSSNDRSKWVYLSDGGHFENLALYEMVLRRCHMIILSDAGADPKFSLEDLGNAIRKIRTDLGVPIDVENMCMSARSSDGTFGEGRYVARATIRYSAVDENAKDGTLIYIKAGIYDEPDLPRDVYNYAQESLAFPHEPTSDQFFSESQFESYRALGRHAINEVCGNYPPTTAATRLPIAKSFSSVQDFVAVAKEHTGPRVRAS